jgi:hypothetical protein
MVSQFFDNVVGPELVAYLLGMKFTAFFLLACGAVVKEDEALTRLQNVVKRYAPFNTSIWSFLIGFAAIGLQIRLPLVPSASSATILQSGSYPMLTRLS